MTPTLRALDAQVSGHRGHQRGPVRPRGQGSSERITLLAAHRVILTRTAGSVLGVIVNEIEGGDDDLRLRFSCALVVAEAEPGSCAEEDYAAGVSGDHLKAIEATIGTVRSMSTTSGAQTAATTG